MVLYNELPVYRDSYNLLLEIYKATNKFSHEYKYCLGQDMKRDVLNLFRSLYRANRAVEKHQPLEEFLDDFELLKIEIRMCGDLRLLPIKKVAELALLTDAIRANLLEEAGYQVQVLEFIDMEHTPKIFCSVQ